MSTYEELTGADDPLCVELEAELLEEQLFPTLQRNLDMRGYTAFNTLGELDTIQTQLGYSTSRDDYELPVFSADRTGTVDSYPTIFVRRSSLTDAAYHAAQADGNTEEAATLAADAMHEHFAGIADGEYAAAIDPVLRYAEIREDEVREPIEVFMSQLTVLSGLNYEIDFPGGAAVDPTTTDYL